MIFSGKRKTPVKDSDSSDSSDDEDEMEQPKNKNNKKVVRVSVVEWIGAGITAYNLLMINHFQILVGIDLGLAWPNIRPIEIRPLSSSASSLTAADYQFSVRL